MSSDRIPSSSQLDNNMNSSSNDGNHNLSDVPLYAESKITRKQAVREIADIVLRADMKPRTVRHALQLFKVILPPENTLPATVDELFGAMLSSENDWRLAQYLIRHKQQPSFLSTPNTWSENSNSNTSSTAASSSSVLRNQPLNSPTQLSTLFLPSSSSSSSSDSSDDNSSDTGECSSSSSSSSSSESSDDDEVDESESDSDIGHAFQEARQQPLTSSSPQRAITGNPEVEVHLNRAPSIPTSNESTEQRSQIVSNSFNRFPFLGSFKRQRSETSSEESDSEPDLFYSTIITDDDDDEDGSNHGTSSFYPIINNNNNKSRCFEMNGCDLLDGGKRRRY